MNKTVNINLAGIFFHIDEDAYLKLQRYLEAIKRSFTDSQGRSEIIADIEARISELFSERVKHDKQVISVKEVDDVISIMGQPEDYLVDDEIFEDEPQHKTYSKSKPSKKLFRDTENSYVGGVSAGLGHYFGIDALWIRIIWFLLIFGAGTGVLLYILLWIFIPEATTTSEKIQMTGEKVTISNIEKKIRDGFDNASENLQKTGDKLKETFDNASGTISESVKNIDFNQKSNTIKSSSKSFFDTIADIFMFFLKIFAKFIGVILVFTGAIAVISLIISFLSSNLVDNVHIPGVDFNELSIASGAPFWLFSLLVLFAVGIPFLMLFYLGLKILVNNLKSMGNIAKFTLFGLWLLSIIGLIIIGIKQGLSYKEEAKVIKTEQLYNVTKNDTLFITMQNNDYYAENFRRSFHNFDEGFNESGEKVTYSQGVRLIVKSTRDSVAKIRIERSSRGTTYNVAKDRAENISYNYALVNNELKLDNHFLIPNNNRHRDQKVEVTLYLPVGSHLFADKNTYNYHSNNSYRYNDILDHGMESNFLEVKNNSLLCLDCPNNDDNDDDDFKVRVDINNDNAELKINDEGFEAKNKNSQVVIDDNGVKAKSEKVNVTIDEDGIEISSKQKDN